MHPLILIVDDDYMTGQIMYEVILMRHSNWHIVCTGNGTDAVTLTHRLHPNLILLNSDIQPASCDEIAAALRGSPATCHIPIVLMRDGASSETQPLPSWFCAQLEKPFELDALYEVLDRFVSDVSPATRAVRRDAAGSLAGARRLSAFPAPASLAVGAAGLSLVPGEEMKFHGGEHCATAPCPASLPAATTCQP